MIDGAGAPPRKRRWVWWVASASVAVVAVAVAAVVAWPNGNGPGAKPAAAASASASSFDLTPTPVPRPSADAPGSAWQEWVEYEAGQTLTKQSAALLNGDLNAYQAGSEPPLWTTLGERYRSLRSMKVTKFDQRTDGNPFPPSGKGLNGTLWRVTVVADHCFVEPTCDTDLAIFDTGWRVTNSGLKLAAFLPKDPKGACEKCPMGTEILTRPWETTELVAQAGKRTLVAVPVAQRKRLAELSRRAEAAAAIADRYAVGTGKVDRYRVFLADKQSWRDWYAGYPGDWVAGLAVPTAANRIEVEVLTSQFTPAYADELLRHELAHVSTLRTNTTYGDVDVWWLVEGMADYVKVHGGDYERYERLDVRDYLRSHKLKSVVVSPPASDASVRDAAGRYAVGYYALDYLITKYGKPAALDFFQQAVQRGLGLDASSKAALHKPWAVVDRECAAAVKRA